MSAQLLAVATGSFACRLLGGGLACARAAGREPGTACKQQAAEQGRAPASAEAATEQQAWLASRVLTLRPGLPLCSPSPGCRGLLQQHEAAQASSDDTLAVRAEQVGQQIEDVLKEGQ